MKLQMRLNQGTNDDVDGHEMNKIRQHARARAVLFLKGISVQRSDFFGGKLYGMRARALAVRALARARAGPLATTAPALSATRRQRRKVDKCRVADKKQSNKQTDKHTLHVLFYRYRI